MSPGEHSFLLFRLLGSFLRRVLHVSTRTAVDAGPQDITLIEEDRPLRLRGHHMSAIDALIKGLNCHSPDSQTNLIMSHPEDAGDNGFKVLPNESLRRHDVENILKKAARSGMSVGRTN